MIVCQGMVSFKARCGVKCWLFRAHFAIVASFMSCLSTADYTIAAGRVLVNEMQLSGQPNWCWTQPRMTTGWTIAQLQVFLDKVLND